MKTNKLHETISTLVTERLIRRKGEKFNTSVCSEIYQDIFFSLTEIFKEAKTPLCNESVNFLAQMYYDSVTINDNQQLDPAIFTQRAKLNNLEIRELALLATMMNGTPFASPFIGEIKRRS
jgi:hypothetical protein